MRKIFILLIVGILVLSGLGAVAFSEKIETKLMNLKIDFSEPMIRNENGFISVDFSESKGYLLVDMKPMIPSYVQTLTFPFGTKIKDVKCELTNFQEKILSNVIKPCPTFSLIGKNIENEIISKDDIDYGSDPYPGKCFDYDVACGRNKDGLKIFVTVEVFPVVYHPVEEKIFFAGSAEINIEYEPPKEPIVFDDEYEFIVLAPDDFEDELAPLITHKNNKGISTIFVSLNDIYTGVYFPVYGRDNQEKIKYFIKSAMENWGTSYVLLVGGSTKFPTRLSHIYVSGNDDTMVFISDLYYADFLNETGAFCSWDSNFNDVFGEFNWGPENNFDEVDLFPEVYIGRLACVNSNEVTTCVNKILQYEKAGDEAYKQDWFIDAVFIGGDTWPDDSQGVREGEYIQEKIEDIMTGVSWDKVWESNGRLGTWLPPYGVGDISNTINKGCGFLEWSGHGNLGVWATHRYQSNAWIPTPIGQYQNTNVKSLSNGDELPITVIGGCLVGKFNADPDCFAWSFMLNSNGGAIAVTAATESLYSADGSSTVSGSGGLIEISMFKSFKEYGATNFGELWAWGLEHYITTRNMKLKNTYKYDYVTVEEWQAFGDPTLQFAEPSEPPAKPQTPSGPTSGPVEVPVTFLTSTTDPETDDIYYLFDWDDGTNSGWLGPFDSGDTAEGTKTWFIEGTYNIKVIARDVHGKLSEWSDPLEVTMPRIKNSLNPTLLDLFSRISNLIPIVRVIIQQLL
jgi:hypothetical protein